MLYRSPSIIQKGGVEMLPIEVQECIFTLRQAGFEAYVVGGCVRDMLLDLPVHDYDVTTSARPEQVIDLFEKTIPTGLIHGTVTVRLHHRSIEVTTYRTETGYSDGRRPDAVSFDASLLEDLARRDFTINAMAMDEHGSIVDPFGGQIDIKRQIIRAVGDPEQRFTEDGLRILRGIRFSARLNFDLDDDTWQAMRTCRGMLAGISAERIREELFGILLSPYLLRGNRIFELELFHRSGDLTTFSHYPAEILPRLAALCRQLQDGQLPRRLKCDRKTISAVTNAACLAQSPPQSDADWRRVIALEGDDTALALAGWLDALESLSFAQSQNFSRSVKDLALTSADLMELGYEGQGLGHLQRQLLHAVLDHPELNQKESLKQLIQSSES